MFVAMSRAMVSSLFHNCVINVSFPFPCGVCPNTRRMSANHSVTMMFTFVMLLLLLSIVCASSITTFIGSCMFSQYSLLNSNVFFPFSLMVVLNIIFGVISTTFGSCVCMLVYVFLWLSFIAISLILVAVFPLPTLPSIISII